MEVSRIVDGAQAVWEQDAGMLSKALEAGWSLPTVRLFEGRTEDLSLILRVITSGWTDGWRLWLQYRPDFASHPVLIEAIIAHAQDDILEILLQQEAGKIRWDRDDDLSPPHLLFQLMGASIRNLAEDRKIVRVAELLSGSGYDPQQPYPGDFQVGDLSPPGHTLWSWAVQRSYFDLALLLGIEDHALSMPRNEEALSHWFDRSWVPSWVSSGKPFDGGRARLAWMTWMTPSRFSRWLEKSSHIRNVELRAILRSLPPAYQKAAWMSWLGHGEGEWSVLHDLVSSLLPDSEIIDTIEAMKTHLQPSEWERGWTSKDAYGISAAGIWGARQQETAASGHLE